MKLLNKEFFVSLPYEGRFRLGLSNGETPSSPPPCRGRKVLLYLILIVVML